MKKTCSLPMRTDITEGLSEFSHESEWISATLGNQLSEETIAFWAGNSRGHFCCSVDEQLTNPFRFWPRDSSIPRTNEM